MLDTPGVQNIGFNLLGRSILSELVALRSITLHAPQHIAPTSLLQQIQIEGLHAQCKQLVERSYRIVHLALFKFFVVSGNDNLSSAVSKTLMKCTLMCSLRKLFHALCIVSRGSDDLELE